MTFTTTTLLDGRVLVVGTDATGKDGGTILDSPIWREVLAFRKHKEAHELFDSTVEEFFKPLTDAAEQAKALLDDSDGLSELVLDAGIEGVPAKKITLDSDGILLRILEKGDTDRLRWVGDSLVAIK